ncbi:GGDEF domain-containing protein [Pseudoalteromonas sp. SWN29]|uniref:GGDEF domain-containing protein n=1 Tax=Pseudoalteromonas sp. SWN29 TaxID=2792064 RepID=UPI0018CD0EFF|nr:GGDEF domain-containing protein [Pseudoalteromonas sp. SWN29]MBH0027464.1 GGDEF domain-containing protein [Pseudoalteromonas sp. SWN29]
MLHLPTIISLSFILNVLIGLFFLSVHNFKKQTSFLLFGLACITFAFAELLACLKLVIDFPFITHYLADLFILLSPFLIIVGLHKYKHSKPLNLVPLYYLLGFTALTLLPIYPYSAGQMLTSFVISGLYLYSAYIIKSMSFVATLQKKALVVCFLIHTLLMLTQTTLLAIPYLSANSVNYLESLEFILSSHLILATCSALILPYLLASNTEHTLSSLANTDTLSQLLNRRGFFTKSKEALSNAKNANKNVSVILLDIDFFKRVNDQFGHETGDQAIKWISQHIKEQFLSVGISARIGGEEFAILLPDYSLSAAKNDAEQLRKNISTQSFYHDGQHISLSVSAGVSNALNGEATIKELLAQADKRLYFAKETGRDKVVTFDEKSLLMQN